MKKFAKALVPTGLAILVLAVNGLVWFFTGEPLIEDLSVISTLLSGGVTSVVVYRVPNEE